MEELLLTDSFAQRLRATRTHHPPVGQLMAGESLTAAALRAAAVSWEHTLLRAARDRAALLADLSHFYGQTRGEDHTLADLLSARRAQ